MDKTTESVIRFGSGVSDRPAFLATPTTPGPHPAVVVVHEILGLTDPVRDVARRLAEAGYVALAVDLFAEMGRVRCMARVMSTLIRPLHNDGLLELKHALDYLTSRDDVDSARTGAIGFCLGGGYVISWACRDPRLRAIAPYYGRNPTPLEAVRRSCPVVGSYPERDLTARAGRKLERELTAASIDNDIVVYPRALHSFANPQRGRAYDAEAAEDAWARTMRFFEAHINGRDAGDRASG